MLLNERIFICNPTGRRSDWLFVVVLSLPIIRRLPAEAHCRWWPDPKCTEHCRL